MAKQLVRVVARIVHEDTGQPLTESGLVARLYDADPISDDFLAEAPVVDGRVELTFDLARAESWDTPGEEKPDLYFVILNRQGESARSIVHQDKDFLALDPVSGIRRNLTKDLGDVVIRKSV